MEQKSLKIFIFSDPVLGAPNWDVGIIIVSAFQGQKWNLSEVGLFSWAQTATGSQHWNPLVSLHDLELLTTGLILENNLED